jgi:DNA-binding NtrC family response regulator
VKAGSFREDLYFRLNVVSLALAPLRERLEDIPQLAEFFLKRHTRDAKRPRMHLTGEGVDALSRYTWPGNIRELENAIARAVVLCPHDEIGPEYLGLMPVEGSGSETGEKTSYIDLPYHESMEQHSRAIIERALRVAGGNQTKAAERLKLQRTYLARLIRQKGIEDETPET